MFCELADKIMKAGKIAIFNHEHPDGDALGSAYALKLAIQGLGSYYDEKVMNAIRIRITSSNWYIRSNAAAYLRKHNISKEEIGNLIRLNDKYANEALIYEYKNDDEMLKYISKLIEEVREEADA